MIYRVTAFFAILVAFCASSGTVYAQFVDYRTDDSWFTNFDDQIVGNNFCDGKSNFNGVGSIARCPTVATSTDGSNILLFDYASGGFGGLRFENLQSYGEYAFTAFIPADLQKNLLVRLVKGDSTGTDTIFNYSPDTQIADFNALFNSDGVPVTLGSNMVVNVQWQVVGSNTNLIVTINGVTRSATFNEEIIGLEVANNTEPGGHFYFTEMQYSPFSGSGVVDVGGDRFISWIKPEYGTTTASTTVSLEANFYNEAEYATTTRLQIDIVDALTGVLEDSSFVIVPAGFDVNSFFDVDFTLSTGSKIAIASHQVASTNEVLFTPKDLFFNVIENTYLEATGIESPERSGLGSDLSQIDCQTFDVGCQFQKAMTFLFLPTPDSLNKFALLWREIQQIPPFSIFATVQNIRSGIDDGNVTPAFTMPAIPFQNEIFAPLRTGVASVIWVLFGFAVYTRFKYLEF